MAIDSVRGRVGVWYTLCCAGCAPVSVRYFSQIVQTSLTDKIFQSRLVDPFNVSMYMCMWACRFIVCTEDDFGALVILYLFTTLLNHI